MGTCLYRVRAPGNGDDGALEEVVGELLRIQRRAGDDQLQVGAALHHVLQQPELNRGQDLGVVGERIWAL